MDQKWNRNTQLWPGLAGIWLQSKQGSQSSVLWGNRIPNAPCPAGDQSQTQLLIATFHEKDKSLHTAPELQLL